MKRLLFVDDEPQILQGLKTGLYARRKDWDMQFAGGGANAIELLRASRFDVLVTDLRMPGVDGATLVARCQADSPDTIRIVLSGYADEEQSQRLVSLAHRYLSKPCEPKLLEDCIDRCLLTQSLIQSEDLRSQLGSIGTLPPMPSTFAALQLALANPNVDSNKVATIIQKDPAVAAKVLQVCNSAFFRLPRRISSIQQAVSYLGLSTVRSMVLSAEIFKPGRNLPPGLDLGQLQQHALDVAGIARAIAVDTAWAEDAFLAGLLHDIGFLVLGRQRDKTMQTASEAGPSGLPLYPPEMQVGIDHGTAGAYLLGLWGLPYEVVETVAHHEEAPGSMSRGGFNVSSAVAIAHALLMEIRPGHVPACERQTAMVDEAYLRRIGVAHTWDELLKRAEALLYSSEEAA